MAEPTSNRGPIARAWCRAGHAPVTPRGRGAHLVGALALCVGVAGCGLLPGDSKQASSTTPSTVHVTAAPTTTTVPGVQTSGPRTVLSPIGLHLRAAPSLAARVLGTAGQGTVLEVEGRTNQGGGWYKVKGATVTGWISGNASLSAPGMFRAFTSVVHRFQVLFPLTWSVAESRASAVFREPTGTESIVVSTAPSIAKFGPVRSGYRQIRSETLVACGVTGDLDTYTVPATAGRGASALYAARLVLALDRQHALAIAATLKNLSGLQSVRDFANSITFPFPECQG